MTKTAPILSLKQIKRITGLPFVDGSTVVARYSLEPLLSVDESEAKCASRQHEDMKLAAQTYFTSRGWLTTHAHIGFNGHNGVYQFADFAMERAGKIVLVECLTHWQGTKETIQKKLRLDPYATLWFIAQPRSARSLVARGYKFIPLQPNQVKHYGRNSKIYLAWKKIVIPKSDKDLDPLRAA